MVQRNTGRKPTLAPNDERRLLREASKGILSANEMRISLELKVSTRRVQQKLQGCPHLRFEKMKKSPFLTIKHKEAHIKFAKDRVDYGSKWDQVIFSDEKSSTWMDQMTFTRAGVTCVKTQGCFQIDNRLAAIWTSVLWL